MHVVCADPATRAQLADRLSLADAEHAAIVVAGSANSVHAYFGTPDTFDNVVVAISDIGENNLKYAIRYMLANADKPIKLAIVMDEWNEVLGERLEQVIRTEYRRAENNNLSEIERVRNLRESAWKTERLRELEKWRTIPAFQYATFRNNLILDNELKKFFSDTSSTSAVEDRHIAQKPPLLHWTALPLEEEMQIVLRFTFSLYGPAVSVLRSAAETSQSSFDSTYHWTHGVLLTCEPVRVHLQLLTPQRLEIAGRVAVDELEGEEAKEPLKAVWPYLSVVTRNLRDELRRHPHIQYSMELIPFGTSLFIPPIDCRVFDLTLFMSTLLKFGKVGFKLGETVHEVDVRTLFPGSIPSSLADLCSQTPPSPSVHNNEKLNGASIAPLINEKQFRSYSIAGVSPFANSSPPMVNSLKVAHNRGRRVSFGTIKCEGEAFKLDDGIQKFLAKHRADGS
ncbi:unnamed protein product, partial [Mesorhabditis belari]|uniref:Uncharacterized protein n=1 Tax=Mesorhabditis belari TaxID=2138241 RepID=A0AAF3FLW1_9BILA